MKTSDAGISLIKRFEGLRLRAYQCPAGIWTIGYGHTSAAGAPVVRPGMTIDRDQADAMLRADLVRYEKAVLAAVKAPLSQHQFDALVSFVYNCGEGALRKSTLLKRLNAGRLDAVPAELMKWTRAGGRELPGLVRRRRAEAAMWRDVSDRQPIDELRAIPDSVEAKSIVQSREANAAVVGVGVSGVAAAAEVVTHVDTISDVIGRPALLALLVVLVACAAIWWWRRARLEEHGV